MIREGGYSEARYVDEQRRGMLRHQIASSLAGDLHVPVAAMTALDRYQNEKRSIDYLVLGPAQAGDIAAPAPDALEKYFDEHKALFRAPEYRKITLLSRLLRCQIIRRIVADPLRRPIHRGQQPH